MILSASVNADVPAHHGVWFKRRLDAGYLRVAGSDPWQQRKIELDPAKVDGIVFWTRDISSFFPVLDELRARRIAFSVQYALTAERSARAVKQAIASMQRLVRDHGSRVAVWRYDPLVLDPDVGRQSPRVTFTSLAHALVGVVDEVVIAFARAERGGRNTDGAPTPVESATRRELVRELAPVAAQCGMRLSVCAAADALAPGASPARCIDPRRLAAIAGRAIEAPTAGFMADCLCARTIDIGDHGGSAPERFCGADPNRRRRLAHDPNSEFLFVPRQPFKALAASRVPF